MSDAIGHLDNNLTTRFEERKRDEVGQIATAFNQFTAPTTTCAPHPYPTRPSGTTQPRAG